LSALLPGAQIVALANWANEVGLTGEPTGEIAQLPPAPDPRRAAAPLLASGPTMMQKIIPPGQADITSSGGIYRVSGFVYRRRRWPT
jgi:hypothetical protein